MATGIQTQKNTKREGPVPWGVRTLHKAPAPNTPTIPVAGRGLAPTFTKEDAMKKIKPKNLKMWIKHNHGQFYKGAADGFFHAKYDNAGAWDVDYLPNGEDTRWQERVRLGWFTREKEGSENYEARHHGLLGVFGHREDAIAALYRNHLERVAWLEAAGKVAAIKRDELLAEYKAAEAVRKAAKDKLRDFEKNLPFELEDPEDEEDE